MPSEVFMPQMGESVVEGTITRWLKTKGEQVDEYEALLEVNTDKVDTEIPSPVSGVLLEILVAEGTTVQAGTLLGWIGEPGEAIPSEAEHREEPAQAESHCRNTRRCSSCTASARGSGTRTRPGLYLASGGSNCQRAPE